MNFFMGLFFVVLLPCMNYHQTLNYLLTRLPMFSRIGAAAIKKDITNTIELCKELGDPQKKFKSIHIAGTNGKGSTSHMLAAILQTAGYKTGLYTSPHLHDFRERIRINGKMIPEQVVTDFTVRIQPMIDKIEPSFLKLPLPWHSIIFANEQVDIAVIEVGLGGRLDSTNIISPEISVITNIGWDHMNLLGDTLELIAGEKAGIIKKNTPVVIGETIPETAPVFEAKAKEENAPLHLATKDLYVTEWTYEKNYLQATIANHVNDERDTYRLELAGYYQTKNLLTVLETVKQMQQKGWNISRKDIQKGLAQTKKLTGLHGRWELVHQKPDIILDVAHNEDGIRQIVKQLEIADHHQLHIIIGMVKDKEIERAIKLLPKEAIYYFTKAQIPRALPEDKLAAIAADNGLQGKTFPDVNSALKSARAHADKNDLILVCGSVFVWEK
jgi:dihydrofolate synthase/folylpolyglutamate synthase